MTEHERTTFIRAILGPMFIAGAIGEHLVAYLRTPDSVDLAPPEAYQSPRQRQRRRHG